jgi:hypothetical protein
MEQKEMNIRKGDKVTLEAKVLEANSDWLRVEIMLGNSMSVFHGMSPEAIKSHTPAPIEAGCMAKHKCYNRIFKVLAVCKERNTAWDGETTFALSNLVRQD